MNIYKPSVKAKITYALIAFSFYFFGINIESGWFISVLNWLSRVGFSSKEIFLIFVVLANVFLALFPLYFSIVSFRIFKYRKYPYPNMVVLASTEYVEGDMAIMKAKKYIFVAIAFLIANVLIDIKFISFGLEKL